jgi:exodeoxyribonuclease-3
MKLISFNVNGIRSIISKTKNGEKKGYTLNNVLKVLMEEQAPDIVCLQEIKTQAEGDLYVLYNAFPNMYYTFSKIKKGYSGVALGTKEAPEWVEYNFDRYDEAVIGHYSSYDWIMEGRIITAKFPTFIVVGVYTPNAQPELARIEERVEWEKVLRNYLKELEKEFQIPILLCGDLNCAHQEIDIHNPKGKKKTPGFSPEERKEFQAMLDTGFVDSFRHVNPDTQKFSYWSNFAHSRERNVGWRIDYVLVSQAAATAIQAADCLNEYHGSDHCPVMIEIAV